MIKYALKCGNGHEFDSWFPSAASFDAQVARRQVACPVCNTGEVEKAIMAPALRHGDRIPGDRIETASSAAAMTQEKHMARLRALRRYVMGVTEDVGTRFPEEARRIAEGEGENRPIRGQATLEEARALTEEGIAVFPLPHIPEDMN